MYDARIVIKVLLYYKFVPVPDPETAMHWQRELCTRLNLKGRIIVSSHGINGTLGGEITDVKKYVRAMNGHSLFKGIEYKWSEGVGDDFPRLSVKVRKELVTLAPDEEFDVYDAGVALRPKQWHELLEQNPDMVVLDARNEYESDIGLFKNALAPKINAFREIKETLGQLDKSKPIATYCTGDVRCEYLSAYMKHVGFEQVYHLDGGIVKYGQAYKNRGLWNGKCYVFDRRKHVEFAPETPDISSCRVCSTATSTQTECKTIGCQSQLVVCEDCQPKGPVYCDTCIRTGMPSESVTTTA